MKVITPFALILDALLTRIKERYPDLTIQYDPTLSYEETIRGVRQIRSARAIKEDQVFPLLSFNRSFLRFDPSLPARIADPALRNIPERKASNYFVRLSEFDFLFKFFDKEMIALDTFEVMYINKQSFNQFTGFKISLPDLDDFTYSLYWNNLDSLEYSKSDNFYGSITGSCVIRGPFMVMRDAPSALIELITLKIKNWLGVVMGEDHYPPSGD